MAAILLENKVLRVLIDPEMGASIKAFSAKKDKLWLSLMPDSEPGFLMIPYSNRIENGTFFFEGKKYQLANGENHAIHGDVRFRNWSVSETTDGCVYCGILSSKHPDINWPWPFEARVEYSLVQNALSSRLILWNRSGSVMPAGFGWHPYFNQNLSHAKEPVHMCMKVKGAFPDDNDNRIPSGPLGPLAPEQDFSVEKPLDPGCFIDTCFQGYDGNGHIIWPESGIKLNFRCSPTCTHLVIYNPIDRPYFAVEPVTNANNGINLYSQGQPHSGVVSLLPNESLEAKFELKVDIL